MNIKSLLKDIAGSFRVTKIRKKHIDKSSSTDEHKDPVGDVARALHPGKIKLELLQIRNSTRNAKILRFGAKQIPYFKAGQYLTLTIKIGDSLVSRPYSISSAPYETLGDHPIVEITIKKHKDKGFVSDYLFDKAKIRDVIKYDLDGASPFFDNIILGTMSSVNQGMGALSYLEDLIKNTPYKIRGIEGEYTEWLLIDLNDVVISLLTEKEREKFELEKLYAIYKSQRVED